ncbi:response regulator [Anaerofustis sp.]|uniref:response regulator n=1 Tax=Anaerofustis sp. TaxID=1872517 RepID=UPI0025BF5BC0|nr:response regulator [Anaerofustis sp.]
MKEKSILIVDDVEMNRAILKHMLSDDFNIYEAERGKEAIDILNECYNDISLILLDIILPDIDGFEVLSFLKKDDKFKDISVFIISALEKDEDTLKKAYEMGVCGFISKPFDIGSIKETIKKLNI